MEGLSGDIGVAGAVCFLVVREIFGYLRSKRNGEGGQQLEALKEDSKRLHERMGRLKEEEEREHEKNAESFDKVRDGIGQILHGISRLEARQQLLEALARREGK